MICPQCGYDMGSSHRCLRCGYEVKTLVAVDEEEQKKREETKVIDPSQTYLTDEYGYSVDDDYYDDPISAMFDDFFGDPFADLLGGLFGFDIRPASPPRSGHSHAQPREKKDDNVVEVKNVEIYDENGEPVKKETPLKKTAQKVKRKIHDMTHRNGSGKNNGGKGGKNGKK